MKNRKLLGVIGVLVVGLIAAGVIRSKARDQGLLTDPIKKGTVVESVYGIGTVTAKRSFQLKLGVTSTVTRLFVNEGDFAKRGQRLAEMDGGTNFTAPFDGTVTYLPAKVGETVFAQGVIMVLADLQDRYVVVSLEQRGAIRVRQGQKARMSFDSMRDQTFEGVVESVYSNENNFLVRIGVQQLPAQLLPGMTADVAIVIGERPDVLTVPTAAIDAGKVYVKRASGSDIVEIKTGIIDGTMAEVVSGNIKEGDRLVIRTKVAP